MSAPEGERTDAGAASVAAASSGKRAAISLDTSSSGLQQYAQGQAQHKRLARDSQPASASTSREGSADAAPTPTANTAGRRVSDVATPVASRAPLVGLSQKEKAAPTSGQSDAAMEPSSSPTICESPASESPTTASAPAAFMLSESPSSSPIEPRPPVWQTEPAHAVGIPRRGRGRGAMPASGLGRNATTMSSSGDSSVPADDPTSTSSETTVLSASPTSEDFGEGQRMQAGSAAGPSADTRSSSPASLSNVRRRGMASQVVSDAESDESVEPVPFRKPSASSVAASDGSNAREAATSSAPSQATASKADSKAGLRRPEVAAVRQTTGSSAATSRSRSPHSSSHQYRETLDAHSQNLKDGSRILNQYKILEMIGQGAYATVHRAVLVDDENEEFAVKEFSKTRLRKTHRQANMSRRPQRGPRGRGPVNTSAGEAESQRSAASQAEDDEESRDPLHLIRHELAISKKLHHLHVIKLYEVLDDPTGDSLYIVFEYLPGGRVIDVEIKQQIEPLSETTAREYVRQIALGIEYLHHNEILHRDIKPDNILLTKDRKFSKIVDFGVSEMFVKPGDDRVRRSAGSPAFMSPELCTAGHGDHHGKADDMWAFGVTVYCMLVGHLPFDQSQFLELYRAIREDEPPWPEHLSAQAKDFLQKLLRKDPEERMTIDQLRQHPWITCDGTRPMLSKEENLRNLVDEVTEEEVEKAIAKTTSVFAVARAISRFKRAGSRRASSMASAASSEGQGSAPSAHGGDDETPASAAMRALPSQHSVQDVAEMVAQMIAPREEEEDASVQEDEPRTVLDKSRFTMSPSASSEGFLSYEPRSGSGTRLSSTMLEQQHGHERGGPEVSKEFSGSTAAVALSLLRPEPRRKNSSLYSAVSNASADAAAPLSGFSTSTTTSVTSAVPSDLGPTAEVHLTSAEGKAAQASNAGKELPPSELAGKETDSDDEAELKRIEAGKPPVSGDPDAKAIAQAAAKLPSDDQTHAQDFGNEGVSSAIRQASKEASGSTLSGDGALALKTPRSYLAAVEDGNPLDAAAEELTRRAASKRASEEARSQSGSDSSEQLPIREGTAAAALRLNLSLPRDGGGGDAVDEHGRPRIVDGPLVRSPPVEKIKTPDGASDFYRAKPEGTVFNPSPPAQPRPKPQKPRPRPGHTAGAPRAAAEGEAEAEGEGEGEGDAAADGEGDGAHDDDAGARAPRPDFGPRQPSSRREGEVHRTDRSAPSSSAASASGATGSDGASAGAGRKGSFFRAVDRLRAQQRQQQDQEQAQQEQQGQEEQGQGQGH